MIISDYKKGFKMLLANRFNIIVFFTEKEKNMKKIAVILFSLALSGSLIFAGGSKEDLANTTKFEGSGVYNEFGWELPKETLKIQVLDATGYDAPTEAGKQGRINTVKYYKDNFNIDLELSFASGDGQEALNLALAANDYPDIICNVPYDIAQNFIEMGKAQEITQYMDTIGKDIKASMGDNYPLFLDDDNKLWYVPTLMGSIDELPDNSAHIRYDEWKELGFPKIDTPEDYYSVIKQILEKHPTTPNGEKRYGMSFYWDTNRYSDPAVFSGFWGLKNGYLIDESTSEFTHWAFTEQGKEMTRFFNQFYRDGLLDPDAFANSFQQWKSKFSNEQIVGAVGPWYISYTAGHEIWQAIDPDSPEEKRCIQILFKSDDCDQVYLSPKNKLGSRCTIITDKATDVEGIMKYINFQATVKGRALTNWGLPNGTPIDDTGNTGKMWDIDKDGNWSVAPEAKEALINENWSYQDEFYWLGAPVLFANQSRWEDGIHNIWPNQMWYEENKWKSMMIDNLDGTIFDASAIYLRDKDIETKVLEQKIKDAWTIGWANAIQTDNDQEFDAAWAKLQASLESAGIKDYEKILQANYMKNKVKLGK
jgi:hypothetical protein